MCKKKGVTLIELILYLAILSIILSSSIILIGFTRMQKNKIDMKITIKSIDDLLMYGKQYCLTNRVYGKVLIDVSNGKVKFLNEKDNVAKEVIVKNATITVSTEVHEYKIQPNGRISKGTTISLDYGHNNRVDIKIGVGVDNINIKSGELYEIE